MKKNVLAIIIPAYKNDFLDKTLESLSMQSRKDFSVYVGDDSSPSDIKSIVLKYSDLLDIHYTRFGTNLGRENLVKQWERCVNLSAEEEWIWMICDDDYLDERCVELFLNEVESSNNFDLYHFNVNVIDKNGVVINTSIFPDIIDSKDMFLRKARGENQLFIVEFVFSRKIYNELNGFQEFDLAWGSDTATWIKFGMDKGIKTIKGAYVNWRNSGRNITSKIDPNTLERKLHATCKFLHWTKSYFQQKGVNVRRTTDTFFIKRLLGFSAYLPVNVCLKSVADYTDCRYKVFLFRVVFLILFPYYRTYILVKNEK